MLHRIKGQLEVGRGDFQSASHHLELARRLNPAPSQATWPLASLAELAIWQGRHDDARAALDEARPVLEQQQAEDDGLDLELKLLVLLFCVLGLRAAADRAELARAQRSAAGVDEARRRAEPLVAAVTSMTGRQAEAADTEPWMVVLYGAGPGRVVPVGGTTRPGSVAAGRRVLGAARAPVRGRVRPLPAG